MTKNQNTAFSMIADYEGDITKLFEINVKGEVPILTTRNLLLFPGVISPILIGRKSSLALVERLKEHPDIVFAIFSQKDQNVENPTFDDLYDYGVYAKVIRVLELPALATMYRSSPRDLDAARSRLLPSCAPTCAD